MQLTSTCRQCVCSKCRTALKARAHFISTSCSLLKSGSSRSPELRLPMDCVPCTEPEVMKPSLSYYLQGMGLLSGWLSSRPSKECFSLKPEGLPVPHHPGT